VVKTHQVKEDPALQPVSTIVRLVASFGSALTRRTAENLCVLARGAILATGSRTVTGCLLAAWPWVTKHWSAYANVLRRARVEMVHLARMLFALIVELIPPDAVIELVVDETLVRRYGPRVVGVGMHRDAVRSSQRRNAVSPGHKWVVLSVAVRVPFVRRALALPLLSVLYTAPKHAKRNRAKRPYRRHRTVSELTLLLVRTVVRWAPRRRFRLTGDGTYGTHDLADALNPASKSPSLRGVSLVSRFQMDAALYAPPPPYSGHGRPRIKGHKLPSPEQVAADPRTRWKRITVDWYGATRKTVRVCSRTGLWYRRGSRPTPVRWVLVRDPGKKDSDEVFFTTDVEMNPQQIIEAFVRRWGLETTFQEARRHLGLETLRNRSAEAVRRSAPLLLATYSLIVVWFAKHVDSPEAHKQSTPWYHKHSVTFSDMLAAARWDILDELLSSRPGAGTDESKLTQPPLTHWIPNAYTIRRRA
jgi:hypothetical protein